jgi:UDP-N-acetylmuramoyl-L-alanyl-D-glutamate--2,6-diaminopimelate ligase
VQLQRLLEAIPVTETNAPADLEIWDIAYDSRQVRPRTLFVAVPSVGGAPDSGGHHYLDRVASAGATVAVIQGGNPPATLPFVRTPDSRAALGDLAAQFFVHPSRQLHLFAVTGTDGKTTTTYLLEQLFAHAGLNTGLIGTVETKIGPERRANPDRMTTPESLDVQRTLREMLDAGVTHAAIEASSHALALDRLRGCRFSACAVTNITADHIEFHGSWEAYFQSKTRLFAELAAGRPAVLNRDDPSFDRLHQLVTGPLITYGLTPEADLRAIDLRPGATGTSCTIVYGNDARPALIPMPGAFNVSNALAAVGLALHADQPLGELARNLQRVHPPRGRLQRVDAGQPFDVFVDYAHTPHAFRSVLAAIRAERAAGRQLIAVFGAAGNRDRAKRPLIARIAREFVDYLYITNEDPFNEDPATIIDEIAAGLPPADEGPRYRREPDRGRAIACAIARARPGDAVLILGKGHEESIAVGQRKEPWNDVAAARRAIEEHACDPS